MGKKDFTSFVDEIPDDKLGSFPETQQTLYPKPAGDSNFRLDMQGASPPPGLLRAFWANYVLTWCRQKTSTKQFNLQIQAKKTSIRQSAPKTWATVLVAEGSTATAATIRTAFKDSYSNGTNETVN